MDSAIERPHDVIAAAARRLAGHCTELRQAHEDHGVEPGPHDDLTSPSFAEIAEPIYRETVGGEYLTRIGLTFGAVDVLMHVFNGRSPDLAANERWGFVQRYFATIGEQYAPGYADRLDELPSLVLATKATPSIVRFDLLAGLASRAGVMRLFDAASFVAETAPTLQPLDDVDLDPLALSALAVSRS